MAIARQELLEAMRFLGLLVEDDLNLKAGVRWFSPGSLGLLVEEYWSCLFDQGYRISEFSRQIAQSIFETYGCHPQCLQVLDLMDKNRPARNYLEEHIAELLRIDDRRRREEKSVSADKKAQAEKARLIRKGFKACGKELPESLEHYAKPKKSCRSWFSSRKLRPALAQTSGELK